MDNIIKRNKKSNISKNYFTKDTEDAIVLYNNTKDPFEKNLIYEKSIHYPFFKLTENIIHTFKFYHTEVENLTDLQHEIIIFLLSKIHLFDPSRGSKAYSYFGTAVKRWLILYNKKNYLNKINKSNISLDVFNDYSDSEDNEFVSHVSNKSIQVEIDEFIGDELYEEGYSNNDRLSLFMDEYINYCTNNIYKIFPKEIDAQIADCILEIFRKRENLDLFNKKALYIYIREMINAKTPKITKVANILKKIFDEKYMFYLKNGYFSSKS
jgi:hypothetical protein